MISRLSLTFPELGQGPVNAKAAKAYIAKLFKDKEQTTLDVD